jgi:small GTP-binding protein
MSSADRTKKRDPGKITKIVKCGVVGDGTVGKTTLLLSYITEAFITEYTPTVFDNFSAIEEINEEVINVILWDTAGQDDYAQIRTTCYNNCRYDVFLLCFSVIHRDSFDNIKYKWLPELKTNSNGTPFILVGTKVDLRDDNNPNHIPQKEGAKRAKEIKAHTYVECTSREPQSVGKVVMEAVNIVLEADKLRKKSNEKQYKQELKKEEKDAKKLAKLQKKEQRTSVTLPPPSNGVDKGKQPETAS